MSRIVNLWRAWLVLDFQQRLALDWPDPQGAAAEAQNWQSKHFPLHRLSFFRRSRSSMSSDGQKPESPSSSYDDSTRFECGEGEEDLDLDFDEEVGTSADMAGVLGEYLLLDQIGRGGMGTVYRAEHRTMNREVALKLLSDEIGTNARLREQFFSEIRAVAKLMHPNIVTAFDAGSVEDVNYLVMELVDGAVLSTSVKLHGPMSMEGAFSVLVQAAKALAYAHDLGVIHRDIKPGNMMLTTNGVLKLLDFGLARISTQAKQLDSGKRYFMGTPEYVSPEQVENPENVDGRSDLYSLGASLCFLLTGRPMFLGERAEVARAHLKRTPQPLYELRSDVDLRLDAVFQRLVAKRPDDRFESAEHLLHHLGSLDFSDVEMSAAPLARGAYRLEADSPTSAGTGQSTIARKSQVLGIDLGLQTSCAAHYDPGLGPQVIQEASGHSPYFRNMVWSSGKLVHIGSEASERRQVDPDKIFHSVQRWFGLREVQRPFGGKHVPPEVLLAAVLRKLYFHSREAVDDSERVVLTVPSSYDQMHRIALRNACRIAGLNLVRLLEKPLAAVVAWMELQSRLQVAQGPRVAVDERVLVVHLSGTGLEASVVAVRGTTAKQLGTCGHWKRGLLRWQAMLVQHFANQLFARTGKQIRSDVAAATRLQRTVEIAMNQLTSSHKVEVRFDWLGESLQEVLSQEGLLSIAPDLTLTIQQSIATACSLAGVQLGEVDRVLLGGSMLRMKPLVRTITEVVGQEPEMTWMDQADMARGAAVVARQLTSLLPEDDLLPTAVSCVSHDLAILADASGSTPKRPKVLIEKGKPIPAAHARTLRPRVKNGTTSELPSIQVIESSGLGEGNWLKLGMARTNQVFSDLRSGEALQLRLEVDSDGILQTSLVRPASNETHRFPSLSDPGISEQEVVRWREWLAQLLPD